MIAIKNIVVAVIYGAFFFIYAKSLDYFFGVNASFGPTIPILLYLAGAVAIQYFLMKDYKGIKLNEILLIILYWISLVATIVIPIFYLIAKAGEGLGAAM